MVFVLVPCIKIYQTFQSIETTCTKGNCFITFYCMDYFMHFYYYWFLLPIIIYYWSIFLPKTPMRTVPDHIPRPDYANHPDGFPASERAVKGSTNIIMLNDEDQESLRVACKVKKEVSNTYNREIIIFVASEIRFFSVFFFYKYYIRFTWIFLVLIKTWYTFDKHQLQNIILWPTQFEVICLKYR